MAERTNYKNPPILSDENEYDVWSNEISMWQLVTDLDQRKQALAVTLFFNGTAREAALEIKAEELNTIDGMKILLTKLDSVLQKGSIDWLMRLILYLNDAKDMNQHQLQIILLNLNGNIIK